MSEEDSATQTKAGTKENGKVPIIQLTPEAISKGIADLGQVIQRRRSEKQQTKEQ